MTIQEWRAGLARRCVTVALFACVLLNYSAHRILQRAQTEMAELLAADEKLKAADAQLEAESQRLLESSERLRGVCALAGGVP
jgi:hypothetical protein